jgi:hypothetical protein
VASPVRSFLSQAAHLLPPIERRNIVMTITVEKKLLTAVLAAAAAPAILMVGAGTAYAANPEVWWDQLPYGLQAHVRTDAFAPAHCTYRAHSTNNPWLPDYVHDFNQPSGVAQHDWVITAYGFPMAAIPTGTQWHTTVDCFIQDQPAIHGDFFQQDSTY